MASGLFTLKQVNQAMRQSAWSNQKTQSVEYLVVAGGGGSYVGGGGAGGLLMGIMPVVPGTSYTVSIGAGAAVGQSGSDSFFNNIQAIGGGRFAISGGSGGGGSHSPTANTLAGGQGIAGQGNPGGNNVSGNTTVAAGGGGAGTAGISTGSNNFNGPGGSGIASSIAGFALYAGGGGGSGGGAYGNTGGVGGGGFASGSSYAASNNATANTGGGGGGSYNVGGYGTGGSGIVSLSYPASYAAAASTTGSPKEMISGSGAMQFNGANIVNWPLGTCLVGANDFTIECWVYPLTSASNAIIFSGQGDWGTNANSSYTLSIGSGSSPGVSVGGGAYNVTGANPSINQWSHIVLTRTGSTLSTYLNGTRVGTTSMAGTVNDGNTFLPTSGGFSNTAGGGNFTGYISNLRIIVGSGGYTATNTSITVPTSPLSVTVNTKLLVYQDGYSPYKDASTLNTISAPRNNLYTPNNPPRGTFLTPFASTTYTNIARVYEWTSSGSITF